MKKIINLVIEERERQGEIWGAGHDHYHNVEDFVKYIKNYASWAEQKASMNNLAETKERLIQVAALAVAAAEVVDGRISDEAVRTSGEG